MWNKPRVELAAFSLMIRSTEDDEVALHLHIIGKRNVACSAPWEPWRQTLRLQRRLWRNVRTCKWWLIYLLEHYTGSGALFRVMFRVKLLRRFGMLRYGINLGCVDVFSHALKLENSIPTYSTYTPLPSPLRPFVRNYCACNKFCHMRRSADAPLCLAFYPFLDCNWFGLENAISGYYQWVYLRYQSVTYNVVVN